MTAALLALALLAATDAPPADPVAADDAAGPVALAPPEGLVAATPPPAPLPAAEPVRFARVDPLSLLVAATTGTAACAAISLPLGLCGALNGLYGAAMVIGVLAVGVPVPLGLSGVFAAYCLGVPMLGLAGPLSAGGGLAGTLVGRRLSGEPVALWPVVVAALPALAVAVLGTTVAFVGTTWFTSAALSLDVTGIRASSGLMAAGFLTTTLSGPVAVVSTVVASQLFAPVDEDDGETRAPEVLPAAIASTSSY